MGYIPKTKHKLLYVCILKALRITTVLILWCMQTSLPSQCEDRERKGHEIVHQLPLGHRRRPVHRAHGAGTVVVVLGSQGVATQRSNRRYGAPGAALDARLYVWCACGVHVRECVGAGAWMYW